MTFNFHHLKVDYKDGDKWSLKDFDFIELKDLFEKWQREMDEKGGWNALFWCNHDQPRVVSRFGDDKTYHRESATMLATAIHMMKGTPYIYQGEEFGMTNAYFDDIKDYRDVESTNYYRILSEEKSKEEIIEILQQRSRDNSRTPMQWDSSENGGFTTGTPWINLNKNYTEINSEKALKDKNSIFHYYKALLKLRKEYDIIANGTYEIIDIEHPSLYVYKRKYKGQELLVICNFYGNEIEYNVDSEFTLLKGNYPDEAQKIRAYESRIYIK
jgi:trehalose-6-phosphate hydrolase